MYFLTSLDHVEHLGSGAFGEVHLCNAKGIGQVAAKFFFRSKFRSDAEWQSACKEALGEAERMKALEHRNVVPVHFVAEGPSADIFAIVMQYCEGRCVKKESEKPVISLKSARQITLNASMGLGYIHDKGFIHRDIKPANIFLARNSEAKLGDFGFVTDDLIHGFAAACGSPQYIAPEVLSAGTCSISSDIYSLGVTFLELTHGNGWFYRTGRHATLTQISVGSEIWPALSDDYLFLPHLPLQWRKQIKAMTHPEPKERPLTAGQVVNQITRLPPVEDWHCEVKSDAVHWTLTKGKRRVRVEWHGFFEKAAAWSAWSEDFAGGARRTLKQSNSKHTPLKNYRELQKFFASRKV